MRRLTKLTIKAIHTEKCLGIKLFGPVPPEGFKAFAEVCRKHKLQWNPKVKFWFLLKDREEFFGKACTRISDCMMEVFTLFSEPPYNIGEIDYSTSQLVEGYWKLKKQKGSVASGGGDDPDSPDVDLDLGEEKSSPDLQGS
jgi:hypothetical protein